MQGKVFILSCYHYDGQYIESKKKEYLKKKMIYLVFSNVIRKTVRKFMF